MNMRNARHVIINILFPKLLFKDYNEIIQTYGIDADSFPRPFVQYLKKTKSEILTGAEIGVAKGKNALSMLRELNMKRLYLIDPYTQIPSDYSQATQNLKRYANKVKFVRTASDEAVDHIPELLDFVYIDSDHSYEFTRRDIILLQKLLKPNGVIGGHDYRICNGIADAVDECARFLRWNLSVRYPDWWLEKW